MKFSTIRNELIKKSLFSLAILTVFGGACWYVISMDEECDRDIGNLKTVADNIARQAVDLTQQYAKATGYIPLYNEIKRKQDSKLLTVSKLLLRDVIAGGRSQYIVDSLDVKMDEIKPLENPEYKKEKAAIEASNVTIGLNAISDVDVLGLVALLEKSFWGVKFTSLKISLAKELDNTALVAIKDTGFSPVVNAKITFTLFGFQKMNKGEGDLLTDSGGAQDKNGDKSPIRLRQH